MPNYKADPQKRCDTEVWAEFTMIEMRPHFRNIGGTVLVGQLGDEWRVDGKADFDGILAKCVAELGLGDGTKKARKAFREAMQGASGQPNRDLFHTQKRKIIERRLHMKFVERRVPFGAAKERALAERLSEWDEEGGRMIEGKMTGAPVDKELSDAFRKVRGCYYEYKGAAKDAVRKSLLEVEIPEVQGHIKAAREAKQYDRLRVLRAKESALWVRVKHGLPEPISTCIIRGEFKLHTPGGGVSRMVRVFDSRTTHRGGSLPPMHKLRPTDCKNGGSFRPWVQETGAGDWMGGETVLQKVVADLNDELHERDIHAVTSAGYHTQTRCWFFGDVAYLDDPANKDGASTELFPDENGVFWIDGVGYNLDAQADESGEHFHTRPADAAQRAGHQDARPFQRGKHRRPAADAHLRGEQEPAAREALRSDFEDDARHAPRRRKGEPGGDPRRVRHGTRDGREPDDEGRSRPRADGDDALP